MSEKKRNFLKFIKSGTYTDKSGNRTNTDRAASRVKKIDLDLETMKPASTKKMLTGGQAAIAAKAPPPNKIDAKDFAVLRAEKAKGRGMGLQDEKVQPGKVMKAKMGVATDYKKYLKGLKKATDSVKKDKENKFLKRRMQLMGMPKLSKGGGYDSGTPGKLRDYSSKFNKDGVTFKNPRVKGPDQSPRLKKLIKRREALDTTKSVLKTLSSVASPVTAAASAAYKLANKMKDKDRMTDRDLDKAKSLVGTSGSKNRPIKKDHSSRNPNPKTPKMMGGGMMQKPMGYSKGGGFDSGTPGKVRDMLNSTVIKEKGKFAKIFSGRPTKRKMEKLVEIGIPKVKKIITSKKYMGGGMMQKPMGYSKGVSVKARGCKLGKTRPTKIT